MIIRFALHSVLFFLMSLSTLLAQKFEGKITYIIQNKSNSQFLKITCDTLIVMAKGNKLKEKRSHFPNYEVYQLNNKSYYVDYYEKKVTLDTSYDTTLYFLEQRNKNLSQTRKGEKIKDIPCQKFTFKEEKNLGTEYYDFWITNKWEVEQSSSYYFMKDIGIALKFSINSPYSQTSYLVSEITPMKLDDKIFELPDFPIEEVDISKMAKALIKEKGK